MHRSLWEQRRRPPRSVLRIGSGFLEGAVGPDKDGKGLALLGWGSDRVDHPGGQGDSMAHGSQVRDSMWAIYETAVSFVAEAPFDARHSRSGLLFKRERLGSDCGSAW